jgi:hypothetical protein
MNKVEKEFSLLLESLRAVGEVLDWGFEKIKFKLADNTYFEIDFYYVKSDLSLHLVECKAAWKQKDGSYKAHWEDDARVKIKVAAQQFPFFRFHGAAKAPAGWIREEF